MPTSADNGVTTVDLDPAVLIDQLLGNRDGSTALIDVDRVAVQLRALLGPDVETRALLFADLAWPAGALGTVWGDATTGFNGIYKKAGASGAGSWARIGDTPQQIVRERANHTGTQAISTIEGLQSALQAAGGSPRRPGEQPGAYAMGLYGAPEAFGDILLVNGVSVAVATGTGKILYLGDIANVFIPRQAQTVLPGRLYRAHAYVVRDRNPVDPAGASVAFGLGAMDEDYAEIGAVIIEAGILRFADGLKHYTCTFAMNGYTGTVDTFIDPAVAYVRPYVQTFGTDHGTQLIALWVEDITDVSQIEGASDSAALALALADAEAAAVATAADRSQVGLDAGQTAADRVQTGADRTATEAARDASFQNNTIYADIATGRAAVVNGAQFSVVDTAAGETVRYERVSSTTQVEVARYPTAAVVNGGLIETNFNQKRASVLASALQQGLQFSTIFSPAALDENLAGSAGFFGWGFFIDADEVPVGSFIDRLRLSLWAQTGTASVRVRVICMSAQSSGEGAIPARSSPAFTPW